NAKKGAQNRKDASSSSESGGKPEIKVLFHTGGELNNNGARKPGNNNNNQGHRRTNSQFQQSELTNPAAGASQNHQDSFVSDDWRFGGQLPQEELRDSSPKDRPGHMSFSSVSTLSLPTSSHPLVVYPQVAISRMLIQDKDRPGPNGMYLGEPEPPQGSVSLQKAASQQGGILSQMNEAVEVGEVVDPAKTLQAAEDSLSVPRVSAPYTSRDIKVPFIEDDFNSNRGGGRAPIKKTTPVHFQPGNQPRHDPHEQPHAAFYDQPPEHIQIQLQQFQHHQQQRNQLLARTQGMSQESLLLDDKSLPPTPRGRAPGVANRVQGDPMTAPLPLGGPGHGAKLYRKETKAQAHYRRTRGGSHPDLSRGMSTLHDDDDDDDDDRPLGMVASSWKTGAAWEEDALANARASGPRRHSQEKAPSQGSTPSSGASSGSMPGAGQRGINPGHGVHKSVRFGLDLLPMPNVPTPDEILKKRASMGILPQDVMKTLDPKTAQKVIMQSVISTRIYRVLSLEEVESLKQERDDLEQSIENLKGALAFEVRTRDSCLASINLQDPNVSIDFIKSSFAQLSASTQNVDELSQMTQGSTERLMLIQEMLLQHEGAVLNAGMRRLDGENRELSRTTRQLEMARDMEKEEKAKWKKEHTHLRIQSMILPTGFGSSNNSVVNGGSSDRSTTGSMDGSSDYTNSSEVKSLSGSMQQIERYMQEINDENSKKDDQLNDLKGELRMVSTWADELS
ncbi:hypothetical protein BGW38_007269, partial [Lunasporangiospora selenospora]